MCLFVPLIRRVIHFMYEFPLFIPIIIIIIIIIIIKYAAY